MRQPLLFVIAGGLQYVFDSVVYGLLVASGLPLATANVLSRASAALMGFAFNRYITFAGPGASVKSAAPGNRGESWSRFSGSLMRFAVLWVAMTVASTLLLLAAQSALGGSTSEKVIHKILVEALLALVSFFVSRNWVFRK